MRHTDRHDPTPKSARECADEPGGLSRRDVLKNAAGAVVAAAGGGLAGMFGSAPNAAAQIPLPRPICRVDFLDKKNYIHNMEIHAHVPGVRGKTQMWAQGEQRLLFFQGNVLDITDPLNPVLFNEGGFDGSRNIQLTYVQHLKKWILMTASSPPITMPRPEFPRGKYSVSITGRTLGEATVNFTGLRGLRTYDATDPSNIVLLQEYGTGQTGAGTHRNYYDGGRYAYLDCGPDDTFTHLESSERIYANLLVVADMSDPANVQEVSRWWVPGMRQGEEDEYRKWRFAGDQASWTGLHGPVVVPQRVEDGGNVGYGGWGHFGMLIHDFTDIKNPKLWGRADPIDPPGGLPFHTVQPIVTDPAHPRHNNLVIGVAEPLEADCGEAWLDHYVIDVSDRRNPKFIGQFPRPMPPEEAPFPDYCCARGRFGGHDTQHFKQPGRRPYDFVAICYFQAGIRIYDLSDPAFPQEVAYFDPGHNESAELSNWNSWFLSSSAMQAYVEYDRNLMWVSTNKGLYCLSTPLLGKPVLEPRKVTQWSPSHFNVGHDDLAQTAVYLGRGARALERA